MFVHNILNEEIDKVFQYESVLGETFYGFRLRKTNLELSLYNLIVIR